MINKMDLLGVVLGLIFAIHVVKGLTSLPEKRHRSNSECFDSQERVSCRCSRDSRLLVGGVFVGSKLVSTGCLSSWNATINDNTTCCVPSFDDCLYTVGNEQLTDIASMCNYRSENCDVGVANDYVTTDKCDTANVSVFLQNTNYMFVDYYCIDDDRVFSVGQNVTRVTRENATLYAVNGNFPLPGTTVDGAGPMSFAVETDNAEATLVIYKLLTDIPCSMFIQLLDKEGNMVRNWTCVDDLYTVESTYTTSDKVKVVLQTNDSRVEGRFWFGFSGNLTEPHIPASMPTNITILYTVLENETANSDNTTSDVSAITRNIILAASIGFAVVFGVLVIATVCVVKRRGKPQQHTTLENGTSMYSDKYFMMSTEYKRVTVQSAILDQSAVNTLPTMEETPACATETPEGDMSAK